MKIEVLGQIELYFDRGNAYDFVSLVREVFPPGELHGMEREPRGVAEVEETKEEDLFLFSIPRSHSTGIIRPPRLFLFFHFFFAHRFASKIVCMSPARLLPDILSTTAEATTNRAILYRAASRPKKIKK